MQAGGRHLQGLYRAKLGGRGEGPADHVRGGGERRLTEVTLDHLEGYRGARPVRVGNAASNQLQLDVYGELVEQTWRWHQRGRSPDDDYWRFLLGIIETAAERWEEPDRGIWEVRGSPRHFVHSKVMCWAALDRGVRLAEECLRKAPVKRWGNIRDEIREAVQSEGYDEQRGVFVRSFGGKELDAALLLIPSFEFVPYDDERLVRTTDAVREELDDDGLLLRYRPGGDEEDGLDGAEGAFLACSFWLAECLARQGRIEDAREVFDRTAATGNELGLFSEEYDPQTIQALGNFPQALTHISHIAAAVALSEHRDILRVRTLATGSFTKGTSSTSRAVCSPSDPVLSTPVEAKGPASALWQ